MAEGVGFEPTRPCGLPVFKTGAFNRTLPPLLMVISLANRPMHHILSSLKSKNPNNSNSYENGFKKLKIYLRTLRQIKLKLKS